MAYNASMKSLKKNFKHFLISSFFIIVPCTASFAAPGSEVFPPLPPNQERQEEVPPMGSKPPVPNGTPDEEFKRPPMPPKDSDNIINYRGTRTYSENLPLKISNIKSERKADDIVCVVIIFNQSIDPRSLDHDSFFINNQALPFGTRFTFNRKGNTIKIMVPVSENSFKLKIQNINSYDGSLLEPVEILTEVAR